MKFYVGTWQPKHIERTDQPLMISFRWIRKRKKPIEQRAELALDSGGFTEIATHGKWTISPEEYVNTIRRLVKDINLTFNFIAPQDWMCEPDMVKKTGLSVKEHQKLTVNNYLTLRYLAPELPIIPVVQGYTLEEYKECCILYEQKGVRLRDLPLVGVGSVCRRESTQEISDILSWFSDNDIKTHAFGVKKGGLINARGYISSADSMAWSVNARRDESLCQHEPDCASSCRNCLNYALAWTKRIGGLAI